MVSPIHRTVLMVATLSLAVSLSACASGAQQHASSTSTSTLSLDGAFKVYSATTDTVNSAYGLLDKLGQADSSSNHDLAAAQTAALAYRKALSTWDSQVRAIHFPAAVKAPVNSVLAANRTELADLASFAGITATQQDQATATVLADDAAGLLTSDALDAALGHPRSDAMDAGDRLQAADDAFAAANIPATQAFARAADALDFSGVLAATESESTALTTYATAVRALHAPAAASADLTWFLAEADALHALYAQRMVATSLNDVASLPSSEGVLGDLFSARDALDKDFQNAE